jgi:hypothetical protein
MGATLPPTSQVQNLRKLGLTDTEIADVLATDKEIDQGQKHFELAEDLKPGAKKARRADRTDNPKKAVRERKEDVDKQFLIRLLTSAIHDSDDLGFGEELQLETTNHEREFLFTYNGRKFKVVLSCPRS